MSDFKAKMHQIRFLLGRGKGGEGRTYRFSTPTDKILAPALYTAIVRCLKNLLITFLGV